MSFPERCEGRRSAKKAIKEKNKPLIPFLLKGVENFRNVNLGVSFLSYAEIPDQINQ